VVAADPLPHPDRPNPALSCSRRLAVFSANTEDWIVQIPASSDDAIKAASSARPIPFQCRAGSTYTLCSTTPAYTGRLDTGETATQPSTRPVAASAAT